MAQDAAFEAAGHDPKRFVQQLRERSAELRETHGETVNSQAIQETIVEEIHQICAQLLEQHGDDFAAYFAALMKNQEQHPERYKSFAQTALVQLSTVRSGQ